LANREAHVRSNDNDNNINNNLQGGLYLMQI